MIFSVNILETPRDHYVISRYLEKKSKSQSELECNLPRKDLPHLNVNQSRYAGGSDSLLLREAPFLPIRINT